MRNFLKNCKKCLTLVRTFAKMSSSAIRNMAKKKTEEQTYLTLVETHIVKKGHPFYDWAMSECSLSRNLYNRVLYIYRQAFTGHHENIEEYRDLIKDERFVKKFDVVTRMRALKDNDFVSMMKVHCAEHVVAQVDTIWNSWFKALKDYKKNPSKYTGRPKIPGYKKGEGVTNILVYDKSDARIQKDETINISKKVKLPLNTKIKDLQEVRIIPRIGHIKIEIVYRKDIVDLGLNKDNAIGIDIGLNNLAAITSNEGSISALINGRPIKAINQYYNKKKAHYSSILNKHGLKKSKRLQKLEQKRHLKIKDYLHKASRRVVDLMIANNIGACVIGHNKGWKQEIGIGKRNNQNFVQIPFNIFMDMVKYKLEIVGGDFSDICESHTSKCSAIDNEKICHHENYMGKRIKRGLFVSANKKYAINADINGSLNILRRKLEKDFSYENNIFKPTKIDIESKSESFKG